MARISEILRKMIKNDQQLEFFFSNELLNFSKLANYIKPLIDTQMQKDVPITTIVMAMSRMQKNTVVKKERIDLKVRQIKFHTDLCTKSFNKSSLIHQEIQELYNKAINSNIYFTISESTTEITFISKKEFIEQQLISKPKFEHMDLSAIAIQFAPVYLTTPGIITTILQKLTLVNINFVEIASTCTELTIYVNHKDLRLAFDTLHDSFLKRNVPLD